MRPPSQQGIQRLHDSSPYTPKSFPDGWKGKTWSSLEDGGPVAKNLPCNAGYVGLIPGQGTKIPPAWNN